MAFQAVKKTFENLEDFLDNLPGEPCIDQPDGGKYCSVCTRLNGPVASDCEYVEISDEKKAAQRSTFKIVGQSSAVKPKFNILGAEKDEAVGDKKPIAGIEKEYPLIEIVKPEDPKVKPLEMELIEEETVVFEIADDDEVKMQESEEGLTDIIVQVQPLLGKAAALGLDMTSIQSKLKEGVKLLADKDFEKAQALLKGMDSALMMDSILFTQNKLEEVVAKKPNEKTLPRYFAEAGNRFKNKDYAKCLDYLKYVVDQSTRMIKQIEELEKAKAELEEEEVEVMAVEIMDDDDDDDVVKIKSVKKKKGKKKHGASETHRSSKDKSSEKGKGKQMKVKASKAKKGPKVKQMKVKAPKAKKKSKGKQMKVKTPKAKKKSKKEPKASKTVVKSVEKIKIKAPKKGSPPKFKPAKEKKAETSVEKPIKVMKPAPKLEELKPIQKPLDMRLKALMAAQKAAEKYTAKKDVLEKAKEAGEDVSAQEAGLQAVEMSINKARELLAQEKYDEMIVLSDQTLNMLE